MPQARLRFARFLESFTEPLQSQKGRPALGGTSMRERSRMLPEPNGPLFGQTGGLPVELETTLHVFPCLDHKKLKPV